MLDYTGARVSLTLWNGERASGVLLGYLRCQRHGAECLIRLEKEAVTNDGEFTDMVRYPIHEVNVLES